MYKIGEFSKIVDMSVRTLRYYDECGILKPEYTDTFSGYRYYTDENVYQAEVIKLLKEVDFSLDEILAYQDNLTPEVIRKKKEDVLRQMYLLELKTQRLDILESDLENNRPIIRSNENPQIKVLRKANEEGIRKAS